MTGAAEPAAPRPPRNGFVFEHTADAQAEVSGPSRRLADLVVGGHGAGGELDIDTLAARVVFASPRAGRTPYRCVRARYVRRDPFVAALAAPTTYAGAPRALRRALEDAVTHALEGVRRVAVLTGGGLDSGALLALAHGWARRTGGTAFATAIDFGGRGDDRPYLATLERHLGCEVVRSQPSDAARFISLFEEGVDAAPLTWPGAAIEIEALARARAHGADVVLTGIGADELFDGDPRSLARLARRRPLAAVRHARRMRGFDRPRLPALTWIVRPSVGAMLPSFVRPRARALEAVPAWAGPALVAAIGARSVAPREPSARDAWDAPHHEHLAWIRHQEDAAAGIESRSVFLEPGLRRFVFELPPEWLLRGAIRRGLFREAVRDLLPPMIVEREDKARFEGGFEAWLEAAGGISRLRSLASAQRLEELGLVESGPFRRAFDEAARDLTSGELWSALWPALAVEAFLRARHRAERAPS